MTALSELGQAALAYAREGWRTRPASRGKE
jgi:hypothetical protein